MKTVESAIRLFLRHIGEDPDRPGLQGTPERFLRAWEQDWGAGYRQVEADALLKLFPVDDMLSPADADQMVLVRDISFVSHCEHHIAPFFGEVHVAYIPHSQKGIVGLSKLARVVAHFSRRLQTQERMTAQIAGFLAQHLSPDVAVSASALHSCMFSRGVRQPNAKTVTTALRGKFRTSPNAQQEFLVKITK